jgi:hypothetical protein
MYPNREEEVEEGYQFEQVSKLNIKNIKIPNQKKKKKRNEINIPCN